MRGQILLTMALLAPALAGCIGGSASFAQDGLDDLESVTVKLEDRKYRWTPNAPEGRAIALESLLALYTARPVDLEGHPANQSDDVLAAHDWVRLSLKAERSVVLVELENETGVALEAAYMILDGSPSGDGSEQVIACGGQRCWELRTPADYRDLRAQAEEGMEAATS